MSGATRSEAGFTLVELLVALTVLSIIGAALASALFVGIRTSSDTQTSLDQSNAELALATVLTKDVQTACRGGPNCPSSNPGTLPDHVCGHDVAFAINLRRDPLAPGADTTVGYAQEGDSIVRYECELSETVASSTHTIVAGHVAALTVPSPASAACEGLFEADVRLDGSTAGGGTSSYSFAVCAHARAG